MLGRYQDWDCCLLLRTCNMVVRGSVRDRGLKAYGTYALSAKIWREGTKQSSVFRFQKQSMRQALCVCRSACSIGVTVDKMIRRSCADMRLGGITQKSYDRLNNMLKRRGFQLANVGNK
jgi:hypothetical protein